MDQAYAKQMVECLIYAYYHEHSMPFTIVQPLNFFGPRMDYLPAATEMECHGS